MLIINNYPPRDSTLFCWFEFLWVPTIRSCHLQMFANRVPASLSLPTGPQGDKNLQLHPSCCLSKFLAISTSATPIPTPELSVSFVYLKNSGHCP